MTRDEAAVEAERRRATEPGATWTVTERAGSWHVVRIGLAPQKSKGTATKPPPEAPQPNPGDGQFNPNWGVG